MTFCTGCGKLLDLGDHPTCHDRLAYDPPRYCAECGRRLVVQITPLRWSARCSRHGTTAGPS